MNAIAPSIKRLIRLLKVAEELRVVADRESSRSWSFDVAQSLDAVTSRLDVLVPEIRETLAESLSDLVPEFDRMIPSKSDVRSVTADLAALVGWLRGAIEAETYEARLAAEARAYAAERARAERKPGFAAA